MWFVLMICLHNDVKWITYKTAINLNWRCWMIVILIREILFFANEHPFKKRKKKPKTHHEYYLTPSIVNMIGQHHIFLLSNIRRTRSGASSSFYNIDRSKTVYILISSTQFLRSQLYIAYFSVSIIPKLPKFVSGSTPWLWVVVSWNFACIRFLRHLFLWSTLFLEYYSRTFQNIL